MTTTPEGLARIIGSFDDHNRGILILDDPSQAGEIGLVGVDFVRQLEVKHKLKPGAIEQINHYSDDPEELQFCGDTFTISMGTEAPFEEKFKWKDEVETS